MYWIKKHDDGSWSIHDQKMNYTRSLAAWEIEKLKAEFPDLANESVKLHYTVKVRSIKLPIMADEFWAQLREALGEDVIIEDAPPAPEDGIARFEVRFFSYNEGQKTRTEPEVQGGTHKRRYRRMKPVEARLRSWDIFGLIARLRGLIRAVMQSFRSLG